MSDEAREDDAYRSLIASELGRSGGIRGGPARALALSPERRSEIAGLAAVARWNTPGRRADRKRRDQARRLWEKATPQCSLCAQPVTPAGPGRPHLAGEQGHPDPRHLWCESGHDWIENDQRKLGAAWAAWNEYSPHFYEA